MTELLDKENIYATESWIKRGTALINSGRWEKALQAHEEALELNPDDAKGWYNKGIALSRLGHVEEGQIAFKKASELNMKPK